MNKNRQTVLILGDMASLVLSFLAMAAIRFDFQTQSAFISLQAKSFFFLFLIWLIVFFIFDLYTFKRINPNPRNIGMLMLAIITNTMAGILFFYVFPPEGISPKINLILISIFAFVLLVIWRRSFYQLLVKKFKRTIGVIGNSATAHHLIEEIRSHPPLGTVVAVWENVPEEITEDVDLLIAEPSRPLELLLATKIMNCEIVSLRQAYETLFGKLPLALMTDERAMAIITKANTSYIGISIVYRMLEILIALGVLVITSPFLLIAMVAIVLEDGRSAFYRQNRVGQHGKIFPLYKLQSMVKNAEKHGAQWADKKDARITRVGRILRATHIDEVPQMLNVIKGDIALIGPRPERPEHVASLQQEIPYYFLRHTTKPGFTGWAQIKFRYARSVLDSREKFEYDLYYLANKTPLLDIGILFKTVQIIFTH
jgi:lipopolysaccharide/colanic/teichoic acid biosynthesis glycosyltransferase